MQLTEFQMGCIETGIKKLLKANSFSICTLDSIAKAIGVNPEQHPNYKFLRTLHCVDYASMPEVVIKNLQNQIMECLMPRFSPELMVKAMKIEGSQHQTFEDIPIVGYDK